MMMTVSSVLVVTELCMHIFDYPLSGKHLYLHEVLLLNFVSEQIKSNSSQALWPPKPGVGRGSGDIK